MGVVGHFMLWIMLFFLSMLKQDLEMVLFSPWFITVPEWLCLMLVFCEIVYSHQESTTVYLWVPGQLSDVRRGFSPSHVWTILRSKYFEGPWLGLEEEDGISQVSVPSLFFHLCPGELQGPPCPQAVPNALGHPKVRNLHSQQLQRQIGLKSEYKLGRRDGGDFPLRK